MKIAIGTGISGLSMDSIVPKLNIIKLNKVNKI